MIARYVVFLVLFLLCNRVIETHVTYYVHCKGDAVETVIVNFVYGDILHFRQTAITEAGDRKLTTAYLATDECSILNNVILLKNLRK